MSNQWNQQPPPPQQHNAAANAQQYAGNQGAPQQPYQRQPQNAWDAVAAHQRPAAVAATGLGATLAGVDPMQHYLGAPPVGRHLVEVCAMESRTSKPKYPGGPTSQILSVTIKVVESDSVQPERKYEIAYFPGDQYGIELRKLRSLMDALGLDLQTQHQEVDRAFGQDQVLTGYQFVITGEYKYDKEGTQILKKNKEPVVNYRYEPRSAWRQMALPGTGG